MNNNEEYLKFQVLYVVLNFYRLNWMQLVTVNLLFSLIFLQYLKSVFEIADSNLLNKIRNIENFKSKSHAINAFTTKTDFTFYMY